MHTITSSRILFVSCVAVAAVFSSMILPSSIQGQTPLGGMVSHRDIDYLATADYANNRDKLDVFMPEAASNVPFVVFFHGGALQRGDKSQGEGLASQLTPQGIGVVSANYRLSPTVMHPAHMEDAAAVVAWTKNNIESYGGDPSRMFLSGHSAGAYLAALLSLDSSYLSVHKVALSQIRGTIPISPFLYVEEVAPDRSKTVWGTDTNVWMQASVKPYVGAHKPPMLLIYADGDADWRREQNERLKTQLKAAGNVDIGAVEIADRDHGTIISAMGNKSDPGMKKVAAFIKRHK
jgi:acetyl esterase/lipase